MGVADGSQTWKQALSCKTHIIAKAIQHLKVQVIPFWRAKKVFYLLVGENEKLGNSQGHNKWLYVLKRYAGSEEQNELRKKLLERLESILECEWYHLGKLELLFIIHFR